MERRDMIKKAGMAAILGATGLFAVACANNEESSAVAAADTLAGKPAPAPELSERDKLIVNRIKMAFADPENPTEHELKHTPNISFSKPDDKGFVTIDVILGMKGIIHPALKEHWIDYLTFYVNENKIAHIENENGPVRGAAKIVCTLIPGDKVRVEAGCNLHGIWENTASFDV
jgi:superoxide reductase